jgi:adenine phosphoribosyltransferase
MIEKLRSTLRDVPDFPKKGIIFKDITPILADPVLFKASVDELTAPYRSQGITKVVGIESRGFLFAAPIALTLGAGLAIVRKPGKLPWRTIRERYALEYGEDELEMHIDAIRPGERVLVVDDVLATGGTADAVGKLVTASGAELAGFSFLIELRFLNGMRRLGSHKVHTVLQY